MDDQDEKLLFKKLYGAQYIYLFKSNFVKAFNYNFN